MLHTTHRRLGRVAHPCNVSIGEAKTESLRPASLLGRFQTRGIFCQKNLVGWIVPEEQDPYPFLNVGSLLYSPKLFSCTKCVLPLSITSLTQNLVVVCWPGPCLHR